MSVSLDSRLYSSDQVREIERLAIASGTSGYVLMQRAARACWLHMQQRWPVARCIHVVCGSGNNGGDGYEIARLARDTGCDVRVTQVGPAAAHGDAVLARRAWIDSGGSIREGVPDLDGAELVVDALFGIGLTRELQGETRAAVERINVCGAGVFSVDLPSGLHADSGRIMGAAVRADACTSLISFKPVRVLGAGLSHCAEWQVEGLGISQDLLARVPYLADLPGHEELKTTLPPRLRESHKGSHGHVLIIGGDAGMMGAALLAARAALRTGAGLVSVATRAEHAVALTAAQPELMCHGISHVRQVLPLLQRADAIAIGPGLGQEPWARELFACVLEQPKLLVVDADALNLLAQEPVRRANWVLTPHPGEAARLLSVSTAQIQASRIDAARALRERYGGVAVLKGAGSLVQGEALAACSYGNPGMAVGGMGDVLTGIIAALIAQGLAPERAARAGVLIHALAGDRAALGGQRGLLPGDLITQLRAVVNPC